MQNSELILNPDGSVYHLHLRPQDIGQTIITVGDPERVETVSKYFDDIDTRIQKREFVTHTGTLNGRRVSVISTGIGTDNIDIVLNELDALVNIDLVTKKPKKRLTSLDIIRIGTSGSLQTDVPVDSFLVSAYGFGLDGLLLFYQGSRIASAKEKLLLTSFKDFSKRKKLNRPINPYLYAGNDRLIEKIGIDMLRGITITCPGFYAPQCREIRLQSQMGDWLEDLSDFSFGSLKFTNFEMETAGIYGLTRLLGHRAISCNAILANRQTGLFSKTPHATVDRLIQTVLERI